MTAQPAETQSGVELGSLEQSLGFLLRIAQVQAFDRFFASFGDIGLKPGEFSAMWILRHNPGIRQGVLADTLRIKPAHMTKMVRRLEENGWIRRVIPDDDRRSVQLFLTRVGERFTTLHRDAFLGQDNYLNHGLTEAEYSELTRLLRRYTGLPPDTTD
ncbi:MarR family transcriptional regulator [Rhodobacterales bacterium HKCCE3408]|nr:MarR family transcriptional regulator [Rhodobacterales bacterium HKCCE3408]